MEDDLGNWVFKRVLCIYENFKCVDCLLICWKEMRGIRIMMVIVKRIKVCLFYYVGLFVYFLSILVKCFFEVEVFESMLFVWRGIDIKRWW